MVSVGLDLVKCTGFYSGSFRCPDVLPLKYNLILHIAEIFATIFSFYLNMRLLIH